MEERIRIGRNKNMNEEKLYECPGCKKMVSIEHFACISGGKGGSAGVGKVKARSREQCRKAVLIRWAREREAKRIKLDEINKG